jgi:hypothetical protein
VKADVPAPFVDLDKVTNDDLLNTMEMSKENNEDYAEEENNGEKQIDEKWKNWDDGD